MTFGVPEGVHRTYHNLETYSVESSVSVGVSRALSRDSAYHVSHVHENEELVTNYYQNHLRRSYVCDRVWKGVACIVGGGDASGGTRKGACTRGLW